MLLTLMTFVVFLSSSYGWSFDRISRRELVAAVAGVSTFCASTPTLLAGATSEATVPISSDTRKLFNEARALESQGNLAAARRLYERVVVREPGFLYGWTGLGNTQTAFGELDQANESYTTAIRLCRLSGEETSTSTPCPDLYLLLLNRGSVRLNNGDITEALKDLQESSTLRKRPDAVVLQNLARAEELNGLYKQADQDYSTAISMTANEVSPFWLRSALVKLQLGDVQGGLDLMKRVSNRFSEAPEVRAAYATFLAARGQQSEAKQKLLEIPDRQRQKYVDILFLSKTVAWPPAAIDTIQQIAQALR